MKHYLFFIVISSSIILGCASEDKQWNKMKAENSIEAVNSFIKDFPTGKHITEAKLILDSLNWQNILKTNSVIGYKTFLENNPNTVYKDKTVSIIDSMEFLDAISSHDSLKIAAYLKNYPNGRFIEKANDSLWEIKWDKIVFKKAESIVIISHGNENQRGTFSITIGSMNSLGYGSAYSSLTPPTVFIWRDFKESNEKVLSGSRLRPGYAFLKTEKGNFILIKKVDLTKTDKELFAEFGFK